MMLVGVPHTSGARLIEKVEAHVLVLLLFRRRRRGGGGGATATGSRCGAGRGHRRELLAASREHLIKRLAFHGFKQSVELGRVDIRTSSLQDGRDIGRRRAGFTAERGKKVCSDVLHNETEG